MSTNLEEESQLPLPLSRDQRRSKRPDRPRSKSVSIKRLSHAELDRGRQEYPEETKHLRPRTRADCKDAPRPCPFVSCRHHLYLEVSPRTGAIKVTFPDLDVSEMRDSCALDVADRNDATLEEVGAIMNLTRERVRQIEVKALVSRTEAFAEYVDSDEKRKRVRLPVLDARDEETDGTR